jgi:hypothetical protein
MEKKGKLKSPRPRPSPNPNQTLSRTTRRRRRELHRLGIHLVRHRQLLQCGAPGRRCLVRLVPSFTVVTSPGIQSTSAGNYAGADSIRTNPIASINLVNTSTCMDVLNLIIFGGSTQLQLVRPNLKLAECYTHILLPIVSQS